MINNQTYASRRLVIISSQFDVRQSSLTIPVYIDAGSTFGDGSHPTTQLCLQAVERHYKPGLTIIDLGTGTGILSIVAAKLGAENALGVDIDAESVRIARKNVAANDVADKVRIEHGSLAEILDGKFGITQASLVVANILSGIIEDFFEQGLTKAILPGGMLVLSGILRSQTPGIRAQLQWHAMKLLAEEHMDEWVCMIAEAK